jgi:hypothetical protein
LNEILKNLQTHQIKGKVLPPYLTKGVQSPLPELSKPPGRLKKWRQDEKSRRKKEVKIYDT